MSLVFELKSQDPKLALRKALEATACTDVWQVKADRIVLCAAESEANRLEKMGYNISEIGSTETLISRFSSSAATAAYHSAESLEDDLRELEASRPDIVELREIGRSVEERPIWSLRIGERRDNSRRVLILGCHHAREWISVEVPFRLAKHLVERADEPPITSWLSRGEIWVVPMLNPDGHEFSRTENRLWRKNRRPNADGSIGVDLNRNYGFKWGIFKNNSRSSHVPSVDTYVGTQAFSEPETQAVRDLFETRRFEGVLTYHSFGQDIIHPWAHTLAPIENQEDLERIVELGEEMQAQVHAVHGKFYDFHQSSKHSQVAGVTGDWTYGVHRTPCMTIELRPETPDEGGFMLPPDQIEPTWEENRPAVLTFIDRLL